MTIMWQYILNNDAPVIFPQSSCSYNHANNDVPSIPSFQDTSVLGLLLKSGSVAQTTPKQTMSSPMTRTVFKQQLQRQQIEQIEQNEKLMIQTLQPVQESSSIAVPVNSLPSSSNSIPDVPTSVLQVGFIDVL